MSDLSKRAFHTFTQGFIVVFLAGVYNVADILGKQGWSAGKSALVALVGAAVMAGLSALKTAYVNK